MNFTIAKNVHAALLTLVENSSILLRTWADLGSTRMYISHILVDPYKSFISYTNCLKTFILLYGWIVGY